MWSSDLTMSTNPLLQTIEALAKDLMIAADESQTPAKNWMIAGHDANLPPCNQNAPSAANDDGTQSNEGCVGCSTQQSRSFDPIAILIAMMTLLELLRTM